MENNRGGKTSAIKICGLTKVSEAELLKKYEVEYAGMILFVEKSKRNITIEKASEIIQALGKIKKVAVTVSPSIEQAMAIDALKVDYIQIHGILEKEVYDIIQTPILRAYNVSDLEGFELVKGLNKLKGFVFDGATAGAGKTFDWSLIKNFESSDKLKFLAGGLHSDNVGEAIAFVNPDVVDVSSGVEGMDGKDEQKIMQFVNAVRNFKF